MSTPATFIHDTYTVVAVNAEACALFRCEEIALVDLDMMELIAYDDFKGLARLRMRVMRGRDDDMPKIKYPFLRCDGTIFWASVMTRKRADGHFETTIRYESEE